jgi:hypothetical protein
MEALPVVEALLSYVRQHPEELLRALRNAIALRFGLPFDALRWFLGKSTGSRKMPQDITITAVPPGVRVGASFVLMGAPLRASADLFIERVSLGAEQMRFDLRLANVSLRVTDDSAEGPLVALLKSGALDLSKPGNLVAYMPKRPPMLVDARDDRVSIDLMRHPKFAQDARVRKLAELLLPLVTVQSIETADDHLDVGFRAFPNGLSAAIQRLRRAF